MTAQDNWLLVKEVLLTGPADGQQILEQAESTNLWDTLYLASRSSQFAPAWREAFGRRRASQLGPASLLELAVHVLIEQSNTLPSHPSLDRSQVITVLAKLIANCCADNDHNRRTVIHAGGLLPLINSLVKGADPNILVPSIYNVCADLEDPAENIPPANAIGDTPITVTLAEERLARIDVPSNGIYAGIIAFLTPHIVLNCSDDIKDYLADLVDMAARPAAVAQEGLTDSNYDDFAHPIACLLNPHGGKVLAEYSAKCRINMVRSLLAISTSTAAKFFLASSGTIYFFALAANNVNAHVDYFGENKDEQNENLQTLNTLQTATMKLVYEVCQMPQFKNPSKYGIARQSMEIVANSATSTPYALALAYTMLYGFVDSDTRAHLLATENLIPPLLSTLAQESNNSIIHPALGVASKLAVTWALRRLLYENGAMQAVRHLLVDANLGYDTPLNTVTFLELLINGHPEHIVTFLQRSPTTSIMDDLFSLFDKGHEAICMEIGRLLIEMCATIAQQDFTSSKPGQHSLEAFITSFEPERWSKIMIFMATKAPTVNAAIAQRVWFALGLLSTVPSGKQIGLLCLRDPEIQQQVEEFKAQPESWAAGNVKFMLYNMRDIVNESDLNAELARMRLGS